MMKILHVVPSLASGFGGPSTAVIEMCRELILQNQDVTVFTTDVDIKGRLKVKLNEPVNIEGVNVFYFPVQLLHHYKFSLPLARALKEKIPSFDIIHIHSLFQFSTLAAAHYCRKYHKPYIIRPLGQLDPYLLKKHRWRKYLYGLAFERKNLHQARLIHYTTEKERGLAESAGVKARSLVLPLGVDLKKFAALSIRGNFRSRYPQLKNKKIILFLSRINFKKGLDILVKAFAHLSAGRSDLHLVIAGPDNEGYGRKVKSWLKKDNLLRKTTFTGMLLDEDKIAAFKDSDIFVLPSYSENFALVVVEAMSCGIPVIVSDKVNISTDIQRANAGLVVDTDYLQLSSAMQKLIDQERLQNELSDNAKALIMRKFTWEINVAELIKVYQRLITHDQSA